MPYTQSRKNADMNAASKTAQPWRIRHAITAGLPELNALRLRSKAVLGYDGAFMDAAAPELTYEPSELAQTSVDVALSGQRMMGTVQVDVSDGVADLLKLFVDPRMLRPD